MPKSEECDIYQGGDGLYYVDTDGNLVQLTKYTVLVLHCTTADPTGDALVVGMMWYRTD